MRVYWLIAALAAVSLGASGPSLAQEKVATNEKPRQSAALEETTPLSLEQARTWTACVRYFGDGKKYETFVTGNPHFRDGERLVYTFSGTNPAKMERTAVGSWACTVDFNWIQPSKNAGRRTVGSFDGTTLHAVSGADWARFVPQADGCISYEGNFWDWYKGEYRVAPRRLCPTK